MMQPCDLKGYRLFHEGQIALAQVEGNGIRIDTDLLQRSKSEVASDIRRLEDRMKSSDVWIKWKRRFGVDSNLDSGPQLGTVLFDVMGYEPKGHTATGIAKTDIDALDHIDLPFMDDYRRVKKQKKLLQTYLGGIERELCNGYLHPNFNLQAVRTYRSSSSGPNFQNMPIREGSSAKLIRSLFIPREGGHLVDLDYSGIEVKIAYEYHKDPAMLRYFQDPTTDMHRDMAAQLFKIRPDQVSKQTRYSAKNKFVFAEFYGSYYAQCAPALWTDMEKLKLEVDGVPMRDHLASKGIRQLGRCSRGRGDKPVPGTYEHHVAAVEKDFWGNRFSVYNQWRKDWYAAYLKKGSFATLTGFEFRGEFSKNESLNYPVQGSAFHCLLLAMIDLQKILNKKKMKTLILGQIHDSLLADSPEDEVEYFVKLARHVTITRLRKAWDWITAPLDVEIEVAPLNKSWYEKKLVKA